MRRIAYIRLRNAPRDIGASGAFIASLWAATDAPSFSAFVKHRWEALDVSATGYLILGVIAVYITGLYLTRNWSQSDRDVYCRHLGTALDEIRVARARVMQAKTDDEFVEAKAHGDSLRARIHSWMIPMMGQRAWEKFDARFTPSHSYLWAGEHDQELIQQHDLYLDAFSDYASNLEAMMQSAAWDPSESLRSRQWKQRIQTLKAKRLTALKPS